MPAAPSFSPRRTRSSPRDASRTAAASHQAATPLPPALNIVNQGTSPPLHDGNKPPRLTSDCELLPSVLTTKMTGLSRRDHRILLKKQTWLRTYRPEMPTPTPAKEAAAAAARAAVRATLVFAQEEAGTAVCIGSEGLLLTCSHCVAEDEGEWEETRDRTHWLLIQDGRCVGARCVAWDPRRDLALLRVVKAQRAGGDGEEREEKKTKQMKNKGQQQQQHEDPFVIIDDEDEDENAKDEEAANSISFPSIPISPSPPRPNAPLLCIGHPGSEDLEASQPGIQTNYDVLHVSSGRFRGLDERQDPQDNADIGALMHDCWTYWGHSGAPLVDRKDGTLVGLHSSWDDVTGMRRGVPLEAIRAFLAEHNDDDEASGEGRGG